MQEKTHFLDAHTHIHFPAFDADRRDVLARAEAMGVRMILGGTQLSSSRAGIELAAVRDTIWATVGFHPAHFSANWYHDKNEQVHSERETFDIGELKRLAHNYRVVGIGECGLDYYRLEKNDNDTKDLQQEGFLAQLRLAREVGKPLVVHCRNAFDDLMQILKSEKASLNNPPGIVHFFSGSKEEAKTLYDMGFAFTFGGVITFARDYDEVVESLPLDAILSETDAPYVAPVPYRGKRNEPLYVVEVVQKLAELKGIAPDAMADHIWQNAVRIFGLQ